MGSYGKSDSEDLKNLRGRRNCGRGGRNVVGEFVNLWGGALILYWEPGLLLNGRKKRSICDEEKLNSKGVDNESK